MCSDPRRCVWKVCLESNEGIPWQGRLWTHLAGGAVKVHPTGFAALLRGGGRGEGAVARVGVGLGSGCRRWLHLLRGAIHTEPVTAACPHSTCQGKHVLEVTGTQAASWGDNQAGNAGQLPTRGSFLTAHCQFWSFPWHTPSPARWSFGEKGQIKIKRTLLLKLHRVKRLQWR